MESGQTLWDSPWFISFVSSVVGGVLVLIFQQQLIPLVGRLFGKSQRRYLSLKREVQSEYLRIVESCARDDFEYTRRLILESTIVLALLGVAVMGSVAIYGSAAVSRIGAGEQFPAVGTLWQVIGSVNGLIAGACVVMCGSRFKRLFRLRTDVDRLRREWEDNRGSPGSPGESP